MATRIHVKHSSQILLAAIFAHEFYSFRSLTDNRRFQINENGAWNVFSRSGLAEKRVEGIVSSADSLVAGHLAIRLNSMLQAVQLPTSISNLNSSLANVDRNTFTLRQEKALRLKILQVGCEGPKLKF